MTSILQTAVSNLLLAGMLAVPALAVGRLWKNQHVAHLLWVIVLAKLVTPPLWYVPIPVAALVRTTPTNAPQPDGWWQREQVADQAALVSPPVSEPVETVYDLTDISPGRVESPIPNSATAGPSTLNPAELESASPGLAADMPLSDWSTILTHLWLVSSALCAIVVFARVVRFHRLTRRGEAADALLIQRVTRLSERLRLSRIPDVQLLDAEIAPMVWPLTWRKMLLLPKRLAGDLTPAQLDTVIAHELAHLVRRDELVRFLETVVTCLFWWNPVVWLARRELHGAEERCCDALVVCSLPESRQQYGEALLRTAETINFGRSLPGLASAFGQERPLKRRIEMILNHKFHPSASWQAKLVLLVLAAAVLPLAATAMSQDPTIGNGLQPAPKTASPAAPIGAVARQAINIGFAHDPGQGNYDGVVGRPNAVWNFVDIGTTAVDYLRSANGLGTPMTLKVSRHDGEWGIKGVSGIFHGYIYHNCQCIDLSATITGLPPGRYVAYVYAHGDAPNQNADVELAVGPESHGRKATLNDGSWTFRSKKFEEGVQYVSFQFVAKAGQPVTITAHRAGSGYSMLNAIQIVPVDAEK